MSIMSVMSSEGKYTSERALKLILQSSQHHQPNPAKSAGMDLNKLLVSLKSTGLV